jgi:hypothetical protein
VYTTKHNRVTAVNVVIAKAAVIVGITLLEFHLIHVIETIDEMLITLTETTETTTLGVGVGVKIAIAANALGVDLADHVVNGDLLSCRVSHTDSTMVDPQCAPTRIMDIATLDCSVLRSSGWLQRSSDTPNSVERHPIAGAIDLAQQIRVD